jgi:glycosyltransferase involved in cell wall biosynthesis
MIVKNESKIIERMLSSVVGFADEYCICDTGSTDDTVEIIEAFSGLKGRIFSEPFVNFEVSRNMALREAQKSGADYILLMDADMLLEVAPGFNKETLTLPGYSLYQESRGGLRYTNVRLVRGDLPQVCYVGVTHEYMDMKGLELGCIENAVKIQDMGDGGSKADKFERDISLLREALEGDPNNSRYRFYLANSYFDTGQFESAITHYTLRILQEGWDEEVYFCYYRIALAFRGLNKEDEFFMFAVKAWKYRPIRAESVFALMEWYHEKKKHSMVVSMYQLIKTLSVPSDKLFVTPSIYTFRMHYVYSLSAFYAGERRCCFKPLFDAPDVNLYLALGNYRFYVQIPSGVVLFQTASKTETDGDTFVPSTPSLVKRGDGDYVMNLRIVNYKINAKGGYEVENGWVKTKNVRLELDAGFRIVSEKMLQDNTERRVPLNWAHSGMEGIEDVRITRLDNGDMWFTGTICQTSGQMGTCVGRYANRLEMTELQTDVQKKCEKNWVFLPNSLDMIYDWCPLRVGELNAEKTTLTLKPSLPMPRLFELARGSSNGVEFYGEYWFVVHLVYIQDNGARVYFHSLAVFEPSMKLKRYTAPFKFTDHPTEYCLGLVVEPGRLLMSHSVMDREAFVRGYSRDAFEWFQP